ncbi:hypothetical protein K8R78_06775 [bacterium]|nr:hypothetical protein [bacterium]
MKKLALVLLLVLVVSVSADFSGRGGYGRFGFRAAYPLQLSDPFDGDPYGSSWEEGEYNGVIYAALEGGIGFDDFWEMTLALNVDFAKNNGPEGTPNLDVGTGSVALGTNFYILKGDIRPYVHLDLGLSFHYADDDAGVPGYTSSLAFGMCGGVGGQFVLGDIFYLEPFVHFRWHTAPTYEYKVDQQGYTPQERDFIAPPMTLAMGLGFGFLF